jgi:hypothetical protein
MSNIFSGKKSVKNEKVEDDYLGGGGVLPTDIYQGKIKVAYMQKAANSNAMSIVLLVDVNGKELRSQTWVSNRNGDVTYKDKKTGEEKNLPGFNQMNSLFMLILGKELGDADVEELTVKLYDFEAKKELPQSVECFSELHGEAVTIAVQEQIVDKTEKNDSTGDYEPTGETRNVNEIIKFFAADKMVTISEVAEFIKSLGGNFDEVLADGDLLKAISKMDDEAGNYADKWLEKNKGQPYDKSTGKKAEGKSFGGGSGLSGGGSKSKASLFDD